MCAYNVRQNIKIENTDEMFVLCRQNNIWMFNWVYATTHENYTSREIRKKATESITKM